MNPILKDSDLADEAIDFNSFSTNDFLPALEEAISFARQKIKQIENEQKPSFENIIQALEQSQEQLERCQLIFSNMDHAHCTEEISAISSDFYAKVASFSNELSTNAKLFAKIEQVWAKREQLGPEESQLVEKIYKDMVRNGALLSDEQKEQLKDIDLRLAELGINFAENARKATYEYQFLIDDPKELQGLDESVLEAAKEKAREKKVKEQYAFDLEHSSFFPILQYCQSEELRQRVYLANAKKCYKDKFDNSEIIKEILTLRQKRALLLGYKNHAQYTLEERMAASAPKVFSFLEELYEAAEPKAKKEIEELKALKAKESPDSPFSKWDYSFYCEKLKEQQLAFNEEELRPYFKLESVLEGVFQVANKLYQLDFEEADLPTYHPDVKVYRVTRKNEFVGLFYGDFFPRKEKRSGAWMTEFRTQGMYGETIKRPFISIVCNFRKSTSARPSLLSLNEVLTLFHEFGHALHGLLSDVKYRGHAGTHVKWDFVELPSQVMENWALEKECLDMFASHYKTKEKIPAALIEKIQSSKQFLSGQSTMRQLRFAYLDMMYHTSDPQEIEDIEAFENKHTARFDPLPALVGTSFSCSFGHIFAGGYAAGYYSYKWAEVLDADTFSYFKKRGIFNAELAQSFEKNILAKGGSEEPMGLYKKFRGQEPDSAALLQRDGF